MSQILGAIAAGIVTLCAGFLIVCAIAAFLFFLYLFIYTPIAAIIGM